MIRVRILTLFPEMFKSVLNQSILKRAVEGGYLEVQVIDIRDFSKNKHRQVDDTPYGGGAGMVLSPEPIFEVFDSINKEGPLRVILTTPRGKIFTQELAEELSRESKPLVFLCGHYEGVDERVSLGIPAEELSIGDYILTGGELPAMVMLDAVTRLVPGVLGDEASIKDETFSKGLLEYPHFTRPANFREMKVPDVLLSGNHEAIRKWRLKESLRKTMDIRPDLLAKKDFTDEETELIKELKNKEN
jgi:tRNA (guanine37-N1)-methyltransferase